MGISQQKATLEEYFLMESETDERLEYLNGNVIFLDGSTIEHEIICTTLIHLLNDFLTKKNYLFVRGQVRLAVSINENEKAFLCPDFHIYNKSAKEVEKEKMYKSVYALKEPSIIIEVLSASTSDYDKNQKFECYRKMKSLQKYIMIESELGEDENEEKDDQENDKIKIKKEPKIYVRTLENEKKFVENVLDLEDVLEILGCKVSVAAIYSYFL